MSIANSTDPYGPPAYPGPPIVVVSQDWAREHSIGALRNPKYLPSFMSDERWRQLIAWAEKRELAIIHTQGIWHTYVMSGHMCPNVIAIEDLYLEMIRARRARHSMSIREALAGVRR